MTYKHGINIARSHCTLYICTYVHIWGIGADTVLSVSSNTKNQGATLIVFVSALAFPSVFSLFFIFSYNPIFPSQSDQYLVSGKNLIYKSIYNFIYWSCLYCRSIICHSLPRGWTPPPEVLSSGDVPTPLYPRLINSNTIVSMLYNFNILNGIR